MSISFLALLLRHLLLAGCESSSLPFPAPPLPLSPVKIRLEGCATAKAASEPTAGGLSAGASLRYWEVRESIVKATQLVLGGRRWWVGCCRREGYSQLASALPLSGLVNILLALETVFPMSASERRLDFLVWCRCFRSSV